MDSPVDLYLVGEVDLQCTHHVALEILGRREVRFHGEVTCGPKGVPWLFKSLSLDSIPGLSDWNCVSVGAVPWAVGGPWPSSLCLLQASPPS